MLPKCSLLGVWHWGTAENLQAKNIPTSLYAPVDYSIITLIRSKGNYHFANQVSLLLIHKVSHATIILGHASCLQKWGHCTHSTLQGGCSSHRDQLWTSPPAGVRLLYPSHGEAQTEPMWLSGDRGSAQVFWHQSRDTCQRFTLPALSTWYHGWGLQCDTDTAEWQLCGCDSDCPCCSEEEALQTHPHHELPLQTHHQNLFGSLNTFRSYMQQQAGDLQLDLGCASGLILQTPAKQSHSNFLVCLAPLSCQSSPSSPCRGRNTQSRVVTTPLPWELYISQWMAAMVPAGPARSGALRGLRPFPLRGAPAQSFNHPPMQSHQFSVCFYFGPPVATSWDGFLREERGKKLPCCQ